MGSWLCQYQCRFWSILFQLYSLFNLTINTLQTIINYYFIVFTPVSSPYPSREISLSPVFIMYRASNNSISTWCCFPSLTRSCVVSPIKLHLGVLRKSTTCVTSLSYFKIDKNNLPIYFSSIILSDSSIVNDKGEGQMINLVMFTHFIDYYQS